MKHFALFLLAFSLFSSAQQTQKNTEYWLSQANKAIEYNKVSDFESSIKLCKSLLSSTEKKPEEATEAALRAITSAYLGLAEVDSAQMFISRGIQRTKASKSYKNLAFFYFNQSLVYQYKADFTQQAAYCLKSIEICQKINDLKLLEQNYRNMTMLYLDQQNYEKALEFSKKSLASAQKINDERILSLAYATLGETYSMMGIDNLSDQYFARSYVLSEKINYSIGSAWTLTNWANIKKGDDALQTREKAQKFWNEISPDNIMSMNNLGQIGKIYFEKSTAQKVNPALKKKYLLQAQNYLEQAIEKSKRSDNITNLIESQKIIAQVYATLGQYPKAYQTEKEYHQLSDSLYSQDNKNKIAELENREKLVKKDREIAVNKLVIEQKEKQKWFLFGGIFLLLCIGGLLLYQNHIRKKNNQKLLALNTELDQANQIKTRFFSILNHDLRSPVSNLIDFLHLQKDSPDLLDEATKSRIERTTLASAENLLHSMEDLLLWSKGQMERFEPRHTQFLVREIFEDTQRYFASEKIKIEFKNPQNLEVFTDKDYLKTIIRNLTGNALKALSETSNPSIVWAAFEQDGKIFFSITDNGPGADQLQFKALYDESEVIGIKSGLGLHLIRDLARAIGYKIQVQSQKGLGTTITLYETAVKVL